MMDKNPQALALAFKKCSGKLAKIKELGITPEIEDESVELLIETLATAKALEDGTTLADHVKGQRWYVESLVKFSGLGGEKATADERAELQLEAEYKDAFADSASEGEMLQAIRAMAA